MFSVNGGFLKVSSKISEDKNTAAYRVSLGEQYAAVKIFTG